VSKCPVTRDWLKESSGNPQTGKDWIRAPPEAPAGLDDTDFVMTRLAYKKINAFSGFGHGFYFWNFRTDVYEPSWSYMAALDRGWIPKGNLNDPKIMSACRKEDNGEFNCVVKRPQLDQNIRNGIKYCLGSEGNANQSYVDNLNGKKLVEEADRIFNEFWQTHRTTGATCDFGGVATLVELNTTIVDDDIINLDDDEYIHTAKVIAPNIWVVVATLSLAGVVGGAIGFVVAMNVNKQFNLRVRRSRMFNSFASNPMLRKSLGVDRDEYSDFDEQKPLTF
jgi:hypothetical protein